MEMKRDLSIGMRGEDVAALQKSLIELGFSIKQDEIERLYFGNTTHTAVRIFQQQHGLPETGVVDGETWMKIEEGMGGSEEPGEERSFVVHGTFQYTDNTYQVDFNLSKHEP